MNRIFLAGLLVLLGAFSAIAQTNPNNIPKPPTDELKKFEPFLGKYNVTAEYAKLKFSGTMEIKPVIKGWYIERSILIKTDDGKIDRELHVFITYDRRLKSYRLSRFETLPPGNNESSGRFEGNEFIEESEVTRNGDKVILRNRITMADKDEVRMVTEAQDAAGKITLVGVAIGKRMK